MRLRLVGSAALISVVAGCAAGPAILVEEDGAAPRAARFSLLEANDPVTSARVRADLEAAGWRAVDREAPWRVEVLRTRRSEQSGAFTSSSRPETSDAWTIAPAPRRWWRSASEERSVLVAVLDGETGERVAWARAWTRRPPADATDPHLAAEAVAALLRQGDPVPPGTK